MAGIGMYGVYYTVATISTTGAIAGYGTVKRMGKAISATFEPAEAGTNVLYANNSIAETDVALVAGGNLSLTLDALSQEARADIFGVASTTATVTVGTNTSTGTGFLYDGSENAVPVGVAFIKQSQEQQNRNIFDVVAYSYCTFNEPSEEFATLGESVEWQTPTIDAVVSGAAVTTPKPWRALMRFNTQAAAEQYIEDFFS